MISDLIELLRLRRVVLFAGAGLSATIGVPTWRGLVEYMAGELGYDPRVLAPPGINYLTLAEYFQIEKGEAGVAELCKKMRDEWNATPEALAMSPVYRALAALDFPIVYTTNYDQNIEHALAIHGRPPHVVRSAADIASAPLEAREVVKFHGDLTVPCSLMLTERDYFERLNFEHPLDLKLRADALRYSILFAGYSLTDINTRLLLYRLDKIWSGNRAPERPRLFLLLPRPSAMEDSVLRVRGIDVLVPDVDSPETMLEQFLPWLYRCVSE